MRINQNQSLGSLSYSSSTSDSLSFSTDTTKKRLRTMKKLEITNLESLPKKKTPDTFIEFNANDKDDVSSLSNNSHYYLDDSSILSESKIKSTKPVKHFKTQSNDVNPKSL